MHRHTSMLRIDEFKANENMENGRFFNILNVISIQNSKILKKKEKVIGEQQLRGPVYG